MDTFRHIYVITVGTVLFGFRELDIFQEQILMLLCVEKRFIKGLSSCLPGMKTEHWVL